MSAPNKLRVRWFWHPRDWTIWFSGGDNPTLGYLWCIQIGPLEVYRRHFVYVPWRP